jgi:hypothetical protein
VGRNHALLPKQIPMKKRISLMMSAMLISLALTAQITMPPAGGNKKASTSERIGLPM